MKNNITKKIAASQQTFPDASEDEAELLRNFSFICMLSYDVYVKKALIEKMIDREIAKQNASSDKSDNKKK